MHILVLLETDWIRRGPHTQHHIFEKLSRNSKIKITVMDYDIDKVIKTNSIFIKKYIDKSTGKTIKDSKVRVIRTSHIQVPYLRRFSSLITNFFQILKIIRKERPDIIVLFSISNSMIGLFLSKIFKIPCIFYYIDIYHELITIAFIQGFARIATRILLKFADCIIIQTKIQKDYVLNEGTKPDRIKNLPDGISLENTIINQNKFIELKKKYSISENDFVIFFMGYLYDFAGLKEIIDYYHGDVETGKINLKFLIVGDGGIYNYLTKYINENNVNWVILTGRVPFFNITEYIELADLCLLSFKINDITKEIIPIKILEYMAMKKPVLSNSLPAVINELDKNNGIIFAKNQKDLIRKIGILSSQKAKLKRIGLDGFNLIKEKYNWSKIINDLKIIMIDLMRKKSNKK